MHRDLVAELSGRRSRQGLPGGARLLVFFLLAAPLAWFVQTVANYGAISLACEGAYPLRPLGDAAATLWWSVLAVNLVSVALSLVAIVAALRAWRRHKDAGPTRTSSLVEPGEERAHFLASWGIAGSACFAAGILFSTVPLLIVPLCAA
jgi:uncharacterized SAM-binding protein YcdF (DUF218 family)